MKETRSFCPVIRRDNGNTPDIKCPVVFVCRGKHCAYMTGPIQSGELQIAKFITKLEKHRDMIISQ